MKKVLSVLLLIFSISLSLTPNQSGGLPISTERKMKYVELINTKSNILAKLNIEDTIAYHTLDSIPILSPISVQELHRISSDYGQRKHPVFGDYRFHKGIDIVAPVGTKIKSTACGIIENVVVSKYGYGNQIIIRHANGFKTRYAHLNKFFVMTGDTVTNGQTIGLLGKTGLTTGNHLHYEILKDEKQIDPLIFSYTDKKERSIKNYISTLITLEYV